MRRNFFPFTVLAFLLTAASGWARPLAAPAPQPDPVETAINHTRNLEYDLAQQQLEAWLASHPADLRARVYLASTLLQREIFLRELADGQLDLMRSRSGPPPMPETARQKLFAVLAQAESIAHERLRQFPQDQDALYWNGMIHMIRSVYQIGFARSNTGALKEAKEARSLHAQLLAINPGYVDAMLLPGMYDYIAGAIPWYMKILTTIIGFRGDKQRGLAAMERAAREGKYSRIEAQQFLAIFYFREKRYDEALAIMQQVARDFPRNFVVLQHLARTYKTQGKWQKAAETYDLMLSRYRSGAPGYEKLPLAKVLYQAGEAYAKAGDFPRARQLYAEAEKAPGDSIFVFRAALAVAHEDQQMNRIEEARRRFQRVASAVPWSEEGKAAQDGLRKLH
jgi:tetratricopeptide (TPR) repeat protein